MLLAGCGILTSSDTGTDLTALAACTGSGTAFDDTKLPFDKWVSTYHSTVAGVIQAHMDSLENTAKLPLDCTAPDYASMVKPTPELSSLASQLAPWKDNATKLQALSETELAPVLLEYLREYQCALNERKNFIEEKVQQSMSGGTDESILEESNRQSGIIDHELALAQPALDRTLQIVGDEDRIRPLSLDIECLKRASLDIRNVLGLAAQASACLPRIVNARGSLRDLGAPPLSSQSTPTPPAP